MSRFDYRETLIAGMARGAEHRFVEQARSPRAKPGFQRGAQSGSSLEYKDFREYQPGDDLRHIDWHAYARSDKLIVKRFHEEVTPHLDLIVDGSASMDLPETRKAEAAVYLSAFFASVARGSGYSHGVWVTGETCAPLGGGDGDPREWLPIEMRATHPPAAAIGAGKPRWRRGGLRVLVSDLLWLGDPLAFTGSLAEEASALLVVQILARSDIDPGVGGMRRMVDAETGTVREIRLDARAVDRYRATLARHQTAWREAVRQIGAAMITLEDEAFLADPRFDDPGVHQILR